MTRPLAPIRHHSDAHFGLSPAWVRNHSRNDIRETNHQIIHKTKFQSKDFIEYRRITYKTPFESKDSVVVHRITHKTASRSKSFGHQSSNYSQKTFPSNQTVIKSTHRGIHDSKPISDSRRLNSVSCHTHWPTTMSDMTTTFARPQKRKSKISTPAVRYLIPKAQKKPHGH